MQYVTGALGGQGSADGVGDQARFYRPSSVAVTRDGSVYVADQGNSTIRKIAPNGQTSTVAGFAGVTGDQNGRGQRALFASSFDKTRGFKLALDSADNLYVADDGNRAIRKITPDGVVSTRLRTTVELGGLGAIAIGPDDTMYVLVGHALMKVVDDKLVTVAGEAKSPGFVNGEASQVRFSNPSELGVAADGSIFVLETCAGVRKVSPGGQTSWVFQSALGLDTTPGQDCGPGGLAVASDGRVFFAEKRGFVFSAAPGALADIDTPYFGDATVGPADYWDGYYHPQNIALPRGMAVDAKGTLFFADSQSDTIKKIDLARKLSTVAGLSINSRDASANPHGVFPGRGTSVAVDAGGTTYVSGGNCIWRIKPGEAPGLYAGSPFEMGYLDAPASAARFKDIAGISADAAGNLYVADFGNQIIRKVATDGTVSTYAGVYGNVFGATDGPALTARFAYPSGVAMDSTGVLWVDDNSYGLRIISAAGQVSTVAGSSIGSNLLVQPGGGVAFLTKPVPDSTSASGVSQSLQSVATNRTVTASPILIFGQGKRLLARNAKGELFVVQPGEKDYDRMEIRRIESNGSSTTVASVRRFAASVPAKDAAVEFVMPGLLDNPSHGSVTSAIFAPDGSLVLTSGGAIFRATGL